MVAEKTHADHDQDGKMINPHNPEFITKVPWYLGSSGPTLKHHNIQKADHVLSLKESDELINQKISQQKKNKKVSTGFRKGACKNCGALTHNEKDCVERPRSSKTSAFKTNLDIAPDEVVLNLTEFGKVDYATKRDQWKGYNNEQYKEVIDRHNRIDEERKKLKKGKMEMKKMMDEEKMRTKKEEKKGEKKNGKKEGKGGKSVSFKSGGGKGKGEDGESDGSYSDASDNSDSDSDSDYGSDSEGDEDNDAKGFITKDEEAVGFQERHANQGGLGGNGMKLSVRNLRLREDTPKYLRNLSLDSAFYDPKSRSMRMNPHPDERPEDLDFAGDNFVRHTGDALKLAQTQVLCWEMQDRGEDVDMISNPSAAELIQRQFVEKKKDLDDSKRKQILEKYLDGKANPTLDPRLRLGQTEAYVEYSRDGKMIKGPNIGPNGEGGGGGGNVVARTKYEEDVFTNNHSGIWGSYYNKWTSEWGYCCCHSVMRMAYCTGAKGKMMNDRAHSGKMDAVQKKNMEAWKPQETVTSKDGKSTHSGSGITARSQVFGEADKTVSLDPEKLARAHERDKLSSQQSSSSSKDSSKDSKSSKNGGKEDDRKRGYNSMTTVDVSVEDMEVYRLKKNKAEDPMAAFMGDSEVLLEQDHSRKKLHSNF